MTYRKKLIEVALPLDAINKASAREKSIRHGHPSTLHLWWARRPLAACRAVLFASLVDDPSNDLPEEAAKVERDRLFGILEELVKWENSNNEGVLGRARAEIMRSTGGNPPPVLDPFCGGGSIPLEAQRLGLEAHGSDLNPVAVLITKALIEIPPKFAGKPPVNPESRAKIGNEGNWRGAKGLAEDVRYYGRRMRDEAEKRIGHLYPKGPNGETVIAWLWARTVRCPNPACGATMPLVSSFWLSKKQGKKAWVEPVVDREKKKVSFTVRKGEGVPPDPPKVERGAKFRCLVCQEIADDRHIKNEGKMGAMSQQLMALVAEGKRGRVYLSPTEEHAAVAEQVTPEWEPTVELSVHPQYMAPPRYGMAKYSDLFTKRQLVALTAFSDVASEVRGHVEKAVRTLNASEHTSVSRDAEYYASAVAVYLAFALDKGANYWSSLCAWNTGAEKMVSTFSRQVYPMVWDFTESNPFSNSSGNVTLGIEQAAEMLEHIPIGTAGNVEQLDAVSAENAVPQPMISTDPPYYDNVPYADLSDYFYVWLRRSLSDIYPSLLSTMLVPKAQELVADQRRHGGREEARKFFENGLNEFFARMRKEAHPSFPITVYYAFKQVESDKNGDGKQEVSSTGWETMLEGLLQTGFQITGTWPVRTELTGNLKKKLNVLASSIVLACRPRPAEAPSATRQEFVRALRRELPDALSVMMAENVAPVDLAQATIGPGMAIYSRYSKVIEADGSPMRVRTALQIINQSLDEHLSEAEGDVDPHTRFALTWFEQRGMQDGPYGEAESVATARNVSVSGVVNAGILEARAGKASLVPRESLAEDWVPATDVRLTDWEVVQHLIRVLETEGETGASVLLLKVGERGERARDLAYRLYGICDRKKWAEEALAYNGLVLSWPEITRLAAQNPTGTEAQQSMDF